MKKHNLIFIGIFLLTISMFGNKNTFINNTKSNNFIANDTLTVVFKVNGNSACKSTIESLLTSKAGVVTASWDATTKNITVKYLSPQIEKTDLYSYLALGGYDTVELRAKKDSYDALSSDCKYTRDPESE